MDFIFIIAILIMSVVIHEVSHGYAALALGDPTAKYQGRLTLNPISHLDPVGSFLIPMAGYFLGGFIIGWAKPVPFNPYNLRNPKWGEAIVASAGPLANILIAIVFASFLRFFGDFLNPAFLELTIFAIHINIILAVFNLIPIPPLDGSKILFAFLPYKWQGFQMYLEKFGLILVFLFILLFWRLISPAINFLSNLLIGVAF